VINLSEFDLKRLEREIECRYCLREIERAVRNLSEIENKYLRSLSEAAKFHSLSDVMYQNLK